MFVLGLIGTSVDLSVLEIALGLMCMILIVTHSMRARLKKTWVEDCFGRIQGVLEAIDEKVEELAEDIAAEKAEKNELNAGDDNAVVYLRDPSYPRVEKYLFATTYIKSPLKRGDKMNVNSLDGDADQPPLLALVIESSQSVFEIKGTQWKAIEIKLERPEEFGRVRQFSGWEECGSPFPEPLLEPAKETTVGFTYEQEQ